MFVVNVVKKLVPLAVSMGVGVVVKNAIVATTPVDQSTYQKVMVGIGSFALTTYVADKASTHIQKEIEELEGAFRGAKQELKSQTAGTNHTI